MMDNHYAVLWHYEPLGTSAYVDLTLEQARKIASDREGHKLPAGKEFVSKVIVIDMVNMEKIEELV
jgi:hypothetical protein